MVDLPRVLRPTTTTMQYLGLESTSSREYVSFPLSVASLLFQEALLLLLLLLMAITLNSDICKFRPEVKHEMQCGARFGEKGRVVLVKSGVDLETRI